MLAGLAVGFAIASPAAATDPVVWKDWMAGCDQARHCRALALPPLETPNAPILVLDRASGPEGRLTVVVTSAQGLQAGAVQLTMGSKLFAGQVNRDEDAARWRDDAALILARALATGDKVSVAQSGKLLGTISLAGASAALLFVDAAQGRVGTKAALVRPGRKPDTAAAVVRPQILPFAGQRTAPAPASLPAELRLKGVLQANDCPAPHRRADAVHPLDATSTLVLLECGSGAYNLVQQAYLVRGGIAASAQAIPGDIAEGVMNADFDPRTRTLGGLSKGRGVGDCGTIDRWAWTGKAFVRVERTVMDVCRGVPPQWWITVDRSALVVAF